MFLFVFDAAVNIETEKGQVARMRKSYPGHYCPTKDEFDAMWKTCLFVLDTNVILDLFRKSRKYREQVLLILEELSDQLWMPHQVGLEYHKRRPNAISEQTQPASNVKRTLEKLANDLKNTTRHPFVDDEQFAKIARRLERYSKRLAKELDANKGEYLSQGGNEAIERRISELLEGKIGRPYCVKRLREVYEEWKMRHDEHRPLCHEENKGVAKYGDFVIWSQLIDKAKEAAKPIIFITNDSDWMQERKEGKTLGPYPDMINEMDTEAGVQFYVYRGDEFIRHAGSYLGKVISQELIEEAREMLYESLTTFDVYKAIQAAWQDYLAPFKSFQRAIQEAVRGYQTVMGPTSGEETDSPGPEEESLEEENNHSEDQLA